jgi:hypothetical protein
MTAHAARLCICVKGGGSNESESVIYKVFVCARVCVFVYARVHGYENQCVRLRVKISRLVSLPPALTKALIIATSKAFPIPTEHTRSIISGRPTPGRLLSRERKAQEASQITS